VNSEALQTLEVLASVATATAAVVWFIADQFKKNRAEFWKGIEALQAALTVKLDQHEREDNRRFEKITEQIWDIELRNARKDGTEPPRRALTGLAKRG